MERNYMLKKKALFRFICLNYSNKLSDGWSGWVVIWCSYSAPSLILLHLCVCRWRKGCRPRRSGWFGLIWCLRSLQQLGPHHRLLLIVVQAVLTPPPHICFHIRAKYLSEDTAFNHSAKRTLVKCSVLFRDVWADPRSLVPPHRHLYFPGAFWEREDVKMQTRFHWRSRCRPSYNTRLFMHPVTDLNRPWGDVEQRSVVCHIFVYGRLISLLWC